MTNATAGVRLGGGGYSYGDYDLPSRKPVSIEEDDSNSSKRQYQSTENKGKDTDIEVFLFTIKDPVRTVISKLMDLISTYGSEVIPKIDLPITQMGPMGYTSMMAFQPTIDHKKTDGLLKPVVK